MLRIGAAVMGFTLVMATGINLAFSSPSVPVEYHRNDLTELEVRIHRLAENMDLLLDYYEKRVKPIEEYLLWLRDDDTTLVRRIALAVDREAKATGLEPSLILGVMTVENPWLKPDTTSFVGATGLMQVMPIHAGQWGCPSDDLTDVDANICHGTRILKRYIERSSGDLRVALLRYNGCVRGTNTPNCHTYPDYVSRGRNRALFHWDSAE